MTNGFYFQEDHHMTHKEKRIFFNWLQKHGALQHYKKNRHLFVIDPDRRLDVIPYITLSVINVISSAFLWAYTEQGDTYWRDLEVMWYNSEEYNKFFPI